MDKSLGILLMLVVAVITFMALAGAAGEANGVGFGGGVENFTTKQITSPNNGIWIAQPPRPGESQPKDAVGAVLWMFKPQREGAFK